MENKSLWKEKAGKWYDNIVGQTEKAIEAGKAHLEIGQINGEMDKLYRKMGRYLYEENKKGINPDPSQDIYLLGCYRKIDQLIEQIQKIRARQDQRD